MESEEFFYPTYAARENIAKRFNLPFSDKMQDWEWEVSDPSRLEDFIKSYRTDNLSLEEKKCLFEIILDSINTLLENKVSMFDNYWVQVKDIIVKNKEIHQGSLNYWIKGDFAITEQLEML